MTLITHELHQPGGDTTLHVESVRFEHHREAIGIGEACPRLSWRFSSSDVKDWVQDSYHIEVTRLTAKETTDSHVFSVQSSDSVLVPWPSHPLQSSESASVRVRVIGCVPHDYPTPWSDPVTVEAGMLGRGDWTCSLISSPQTVDISLPKRPVLFRRPFKLDQGTIVNRARLYITAHGVYEAHINGQRVGDHVLAPGWTSYKHHLAYQTYDVTGLLRSGEENALCVQVAEGWFCGRLGFLGGVRNIWGDRIGLVAQLVIDTGDGLATVVGSDSEWKCGTGSITSSEIYDGEICDLSLEPSGWLYPGFDDAGWLPAQSNSLPSAALVAPDGLPVRVIETLSAKSVFTTPSGRIVVDFGQNVVGWVRIRLHNERGRTVRLTYTEELENGEVAIRPLRMCKSTDTVILSGQGGEDVVWEPKFTFHGFRYVQLDGVCDHTDEFDLHSVTAVVVHTSMEQTGWFDCSNQLLNQLHNNVRWSMRGNFISIPTDCPQRDERLGWTGDIHVFGPTASYLYDTSGMLKGWLKDLAAEQLVDHGSVPPFFCPDVPVDDTRYPTAIWGDTLVGLPWTLYQSYADRGILNDQLQSMKTWMDEGVSRDPVTSLWHEDSYQFGDWLDPLAPPDDPGNSITDPQLVANAYLVHTTFLIHKVCLALGHDTLAETYKTSWARVRKAFQRRYISEEGRVVGDSQTGLALCIHFGLFDQAEQEATAASRLKHLVLRNARFKIATGFAGTPIIGHVLSKVGETQLFYRMLYHRKLPSWLYQVSMGATTMWERWDSKLPDGSINPGEMTSFNHYALGAVADWMHTHIAGLSILEPGWKRFRVAPVPGGDLSYANAEFLSPYGMISVKWKIHGARFSLNVQVPPNSSAEIILPGVSPMDRKLVGSGFYKFDSDYEAPAWPPKPLYPQFYTHDDDEP